MQVDIFDNIDWALLKKQKAWLVEFPDTGNNTDSEAVDGLLAFIDGIQEYAVDVLGIPENDVFTSEYDEDDIEGNTPCEQCGSQKNLLFENCLCTDCDPRTNPDQRKPFPKA